MAEACQKTAWPVHAFCLMSNHYHSVLGTPNANLVAGMAWQQSTYTIRLGTSNTANARLHRAMKELGLAGSSQRSVGI